MPVSPLWTSAEERAAVIDKYCAASVLTADLKAELARQRRLAKETLQRLAGGGPSELVAGYAAAVLAAARPNAAAAASAA